MAAPSEPTDPMDISSSKGRTFFSERGVTVTCQCIQVGGTVYPISEIQKISIENNNPNSGRAFAGLLIFSMLTFGSIIATGFSQSEKEISGGVFWTIIFGCVTAWCFKSLFRSEAHHLEITNFTGKHRALTSLDANFVQRIATAIEEVRN